MKMENTKHGETGTQNSNVKKASQNSKALEFDV